MSVNAQKKSVYQSSQFEASKVVLNNLSQFKISPATKLVLLYLVDCYNPNKPNVYPKQTTIESKLGLSLATVKRAIKELSAEGLIVYETKHNNFYKFTSKIFDLFKLIPSTVQNDTQVGVNLTPHEQIKEKKMNSENFQKNKVVDFANKKRRPYEHFNHITGQEYKPYNSKELVKDDKNPMSDRETAIKFINSFTQKELQNLIIKKQVAKVKEHWGLS